MKKMILWAIIAITAAFAIPQNAAAGDGKTMQTAIDLTSAGWNKAWEDHGQTKFSYSGYVYFSSPKQVVYFKFVTLKGYVSKIGIGFDEVETYFKGCSQNKWSELPGWANDDVDGGVTYYFRLHAPDGKKGKYNFSVSYTVFQKLGKDQDEPNNTLAQATELPYSSNICFAATIHNIKDVDYYKINLPAGHDYEVSVVSDSSYTSSSGFYYVGRKADFLEESKKGYSENLSTNYLSYESFGGVEFKNGGWCYICFTANGDDEGGNPGRYRVNISIKEK